MGKSTKWLFGLGALLGICFLASPIVAQEKRDAPPMVQKSLRAGLVLLDEKTAYAVSPTGAMDAVDLQTGKVLWTVTPPRAPDTNASGFEHHGCYWPMAVDGRRLVVRERDSDMHKWKTIRILVLDLNQKGKVVKQFDAELPGVWWNDPIRHIAGGARLPPPPVPVFRSESRIEDGKLFVAWESESWWMDRPEKEIKKGESGLIEVDLQSGKVRQRKSDKKTTEPTQIVVGERKLTVIDVTTESRSGPVTSSSTLPRLQAIDTKTGKVVWQRLLRGGWTFGANGLAP